MADLQSIATTASLILLVAVPAIVLHECAHGWAAYKLGDPTAKLMGRLTLNPIKHIDPFGTILVPALLYLVHALGWTHSLILFGWAKPVPVNFSRLGNPKRDMGLVAVAGPLTNILIAVFLAQLIKFGVMPSLSPVLFWGVMLNLSLAIFNLLPIPPLDGSRVVASFLPEKLEKMYSYLEPFGFIIVLVGLQLGWLNILNPIILQAIRWVGLS
jgi:Zn-dependent protease